MQISKLKGKFEKGFLPNFSTELFTATIKHVDVYEVEKILKKQGRGSNVQYFVKWLGYPNKFNSWVNASEINMI